MSAFPPGIVVKGPRNHESLLRAHVRTDPRDLAAAEVEMKEYMVGRNCPAGLLVTPERSRIYRHMQMSDSPESILVEGEFATEHLLGKIPASMSALELEELLQRRLEHLQARGSMSDLPLEIRELFEDSIRPALAVGSIGAAGPRWHLRPTGS